MRNLCTRIRNFLHKHWIETLYHKGHVAAHCSYFAAVFIEGHGFYAALGGLMLLFTLIGLLMGDE